MCYFEISQSTWFKSGSLALVFLITHCSAAKDCGSLAMPMNGSVIGEETSYPNEVTFACDDGFIMAGSRIRKCQSNGIWSGNETFCRGMFTFLNFLHIEDKVFL